MVVALGVSKCPVVHDGRKDLFLLNLHVNGVLGFDVVVGLDVPAKIETEVISLVAAPGHHCRVKRLK